MKKHIKLEVDHDNPASGRIDLYFAEQMKDPAFRAGVEAEKLKLSVSIALIRLRKAKKMTQKQLADKVGMTQSAVARLELGQTNMTIETICRFAQVYGKTATVVLK